MVEGTFIPLGLLIRFHCASRGALIHTPFIKLSKVVPMHHASGRKPRLHQAKPIIDSVLLQRSCPLATNSPLLRSSHVRLISSQTPYTSIIRPAILSIVLDFQLRLMLHARNLSVILRAAIKALSAFSATPKGRASRPFCQHGSQNHISSRSLRLLAILSPTEEISPNFTTAVNLPPRVDCYWPSMALTQLIMWQICSHSRRLHCEASHSFILTRRYALL